MYSKIDVRIKLLHLLISIVLVFLTDNYLEVISLFIIGILLLIINKIVHIFLEESISIRF